MVPWNLLFIHIFPEIIKRGGWTVISHIIIHLQITLFYQNLKKINKNWFNPDKVTIMSICISFIMAHQYRNNGLPYQLLHQNVYIMSMEFILHNTYCQWVTVKGQLISKCPFGVFKSTKTDFLRIFAIASNKRLN